MLDKLQGKAKILTPAEASSMVADIQEPGVVAVRMALIPVDVAEAIVLAEEQIFGPRP